MESIKEQVRVALEHLDNTQKLIGYAEETRTQKRNELLARIVAMCSDAAKEAEDHRESLKNSLAKMNNEIESMALLLGELCPSFPNADSLTLDKHHQLLLQIHKSIQDRYNLRLNNVRSLLDRIRSARSDLGLPVIEVAVGEDVSPARISTLELDLGKLDEEKRNRAQQARQTCTTIVQLWAELAIHAQTDLDQRILRRDLDQTVNGDLLRQLESKRIVLQDERARRISQKNDMLVELEVLWVKLKVSEAERRAIKDTTAGLATSDLERCREELERCRQRKRDSIPQFVMDARAELADLWEQLYYPEERRAEFAIAFNTVFTDESLAAHEEEIAKLKVKLESFTQVSALLDEHRQIKQDFEEFTRMTSDSSRLMNRKRPINLLEEGKSRTRFQKRIPLIEKQLKEKLAAWEAEEKRPFLVRGVRYLDVLSDPSVLWQTGDAPVVPAATTLKTMTTASRSNVAAKPVARSAGTTSKLPLRTPTKENRGRASMKPAGTPTRSATWTGRPSDLLESESPAKKARMSS